MKASRLAPFLGSSPLHSLRFLVLVLPIWGAPLTAPSYPEVARRLGCKKAMDRMSSVWPSRLRSGAHAEAPMCLSSFQTITWTGSGRGLCGSGCGRRAWCGGCGAVVRRQWWAGWVGDVRSPLQGGDTSCGRGRGCGRGAPYPPPSKMNWPRNQPMATAPTKPPSLEKKDRVRQHPNTRPYPLPTTYKGRAMFTFRFHPPATMYFCCDSVRNRMDEISVGEPEARWRRHWPLEKFHTRT